MANKHVEMIPDTFYHTWEIFGGVNIGELGEFVAIRQIFTLQMS